MSTAGLNTLPTDRALSILIGQYAEAANLKTYITNLMEEFNELHANSLDALTLRTLETATGFTLDVIGILVGQGRGTKLAIGGIFFGFENSIGGGTFGSTGNAATGEVFRSAGDQEYDTVTWSDEEYRKFIKARIIKNTKAITVNTIIEVILTVVDGISDVVVEFVDNTKFSITIPEAVGDNDKLLLLTDELIPIPAGCTYTLADLNGPINI